MARSSTAVSAAKSHWGSPFDDEAAYDERRAYEDDAAVELDAAALLDAALDEGGGLRARSGTMLWWVHSEGGGR